jgi:hypothetical protein
MKTQEVSHLTTVMLTLGVLVCLAGAFLMGWGEPIVGDNHTGIATVIGIIGIGMITKAKRGKA